MSERASIAMGWTIVAICLSVLFIPWDTPGRLFSWAVSWLKRRRMRRAMKHPVG